MIFAFAHAEFTSIVLFGCDMLDSELQLRIACPSRPRSTTSVAPQSTLLVCHNHGSGIQYRRTPVSVVPKSCWEPAGSNLQRSLDPLSLAVLFLISCRDDVTLPRTFYGNSAIREPELIGFTLRQL